MPLSGSAAKQAMIRIMDTIDEAYAPHNMTPQEAIAFLEELSADIESKLEALREESEEEPD